MASEQGPLVGLKVLDLSTIISGGTCTAMLADFGADVIKVEQPGTGDPLRTWEPMKDGVSLWWKVMSRNKRSITLNLRVPEGQDILKRLIKDTDVLVENFRSGTLERWDLGWEALKGVNPRLIMVRISGFGQTGPYRERPGYGTVAEAMSGLVHVTGFPDGPPQLPPMALADEVTGLIAASSAMFAMYERDRKGSGQGQVIDLSLYESLFRLLMQQVPEYTLLGHAPERLGSRYPYISPRNLYRTRDGWLAISVGSDAVWARLAKAMGREEMVRDPRFATLSQRVKNGEEVDAAVASWMAEQGTEEAARVLQEAEAVVGHIYDLPAILKDPQYQAREDIITVEDPELGAIPMPGVVPRFLRTPGAVRSAGPRLGQHNREVYGLRLGLAPGQLKQLQEKGII